MQGQRILEWVQGVVAAMDAGGRQDAFELSVVPVLVLPLAERRIEAVASELPGGKFQRRIENQGLPDQATGVVARGIVVVGPQLVGGAIRQPAFRIDVEQADLRAAAVVAVADDGDGIAGDQHFVVPAATGIHTGSKSIYGCDRAQRVAAHFQSKQPAAPQYYQMASVLLDDAAFVDARGLDVGEGDAIRWLWA